MPQHDMDNIQIIRKVVKLYENNRCLWDPNQKHYFNKISRERTWRKISAEVNIPALEVKKKVNSLLGSYRREKSREKRSQLRKGAVTVYKSKWFAYPWFSFMKNKTQPRPTPDAGCDETVDTTESKADENNEETLNIDSLNIPTGENTEECMEKLFKSYTKKEYWKINLQNGNPDSSNNVGPKNKMRKKLLKSSSLSKESSVDHFTAFGTYVANELRKYDEQLVPRVKKAILNIIFQADIGQFPVQHNYTYTSCYHTVSPCTDPIASPPHDQMRESSDSTLELNMDSDNEDQKMLME